MKNNGLVSVIIPTYNREKMLIECVDSVLASTYQNIEVIVVDNKSTDNTVEAVQKAYADDLRVKLVALQENMMAAGGRNAGIKVSNGEYLLFCDSDNIVSTDMIEIMVETAMEDEGIGFLAPLSINGNATWITSGDYNFFTSAPKTRGGGYERKI